MLVAFTGFCIASYIYHRKRTKRPLVCPMRGSCDFVTESAYAKFLGIHVEQIGMVYYMAVFLFHAVVLVDPALFTLNAAIWSLAVVSAAFLFSLYLVGVQAFVVRHWCTWCVCSALVCTAIFLITFLGRPLGIL